MAGVGAAAVVGGGALMLAPISNLKSETSNSAPVARSERVVAIRYPAGASNLFWDVQKSTNLVTWVTVLSNCWTWLPGTNGDIWTYSTNGAREFTRMRGHKWEGITL